MTPETHLPIKSQQQTFSNDFVRAYFLRTFFGRIQKTDIVRTIGSQEEWRYGLGKYAIIPNEVFQDNMPPSMKRIANAYADMMMRLYESGWVIMGNNIFTPSGQLRRKSASQTFLEDDEELWLRNWASIDLRANTMMLKDSLSVFTLLFPPPSVLRGIDYGSILQAILGSNNLIDGGVLFTGNKEWDEEGWRFAIKIDDTYSVIFNMGEWSNNYGYRASNFELIYSSNISIKEKEEENNYFYPESLRIVVDNEEGVWTSPIEFCIPYQSAKSSIKTLNFSRGGFL